ncbi:MAG TPA: biopolymer transporter ExbD [Candidatus Solibacter sp.]|nr:biopolymer transporter ExbD [Candidatus Solibacter sp.]
MKCLLSVCLAIAAVIAGSFVIEAAQTPKLQKGVSVQMAVAQRASAMPAADDENAWVVTINQDGNLFFGTFAVSRQTLIKQMTMTPRNREQNLYIKADACTPFANVERVLEAGRQVAFETPVLLTAPPRPAAFGTVTPPNGLQILAGPTPAGKVATVVELLNSGQQQPSLKVNGDEISWSALESTLMQHFQKGDEKLILLRADAKLPFAQVVQVIDLCRGTGAEVAIGEPTV